MQLAPRPVRLGEKYIFQNFLTWEVLFLKCFVNSQFKCKPKDLLSTSYNWLQSQQGCHVGNGIYVFVSVSLNKIGAWAWVVGATVSLSSWNLFAHNEGVFTKKKLPLRKRSSMDLPKGHLQHKDKRECDKRSRSFQFDSYGGTYVDSNSSTHVERLANPNSPFVAETANLCLSFMSHKNSEPLVQGTNTCRVSNHLNFSWTSGLSSWACDLSNSLAQCLVSRNISVKHWSRAVCFSSAFLWRYISCLLSWFLLSLSISSGHDH